MEKREEKLGRGSMFYRKSDQFSDQFSGSTRSAKEQNSQKPTEMLFRFLAQRRPHQKISSQRGKLEQKSYDFWTKFQKQKRWIAAAVHRYLIYLRLGLWKTKGLARWRALFVLSVLPFITPPPDFCSDSRKRGEREQKSSEILSKAFDRRRCGTSSMNCSAILPVYRL